MERNKQGVTKWGCQPKQIHVRRCKPSPRAVYIGNIDSRKQRSIQKVHHADAIIWYWNVIDSGSVFYGVK